MKRSLAILALMIAASLTAGAQSLCIKHSGEAIPARFGIQIDRTLLKEVEFYGPLGLQDTLNVNLQVFADNESANAFIRQYEPTAYGNYCSGMYIPLIETAVLVASDDMEKAVKTLYHEMSHFLYQSAIASTYNSVSLNEGLACYFEFLKIKNDGSVCQRPDAIYVNAMKTLIEIDEFDLSEYLRMTPRQFTYKSRHEGHASYYASYVIVATLFDRLGTDQMRNLLTMIRSGVSYEEAVEALYPGGCSALDEDIRSFVLRH